MISNFAPKDKRSNVLLMIIDEKRFAIEKQNGFGNNFCGTYRTVQR